MAGDWIKWSKGLAVKPEVIRMAGMLSLDRFAVAGRLMVLWEWADENIAESDILEDGKKTSVRLSPKDGDNMALVDALVSTPKFADTLASVRWISFRNGCIEFPNFGRHNGKTAKTRARNAQNQQESRARNDSGQTTPTSKSPRKPRRVIGTSPHGGDGIVTREEESAEKKEQLPPNPPGGGEPPPAGEREIRQVLVRAKHLGCDFPGKAAREAIRLCGLQHVHELLDFAEDRAIRGADLHGRLERATPDLAPTAGWDSVQPATPRSKADEMARLKATWGKAIEQMPVDQFRAYALEGVNAGLRGMVREDRKTKEIEAAWIAVAKILDERRAG